MASSMIGLVVMILLTMVLLMTLMLIFVTAHAHLHVPLMAGSVNHHVLALCMVLAVHVVRVGG